MSLRQNLHLVVLLTILFVLASCGGGSDSVEPTATPEPTLTIEERRTFAPGLPQNPVRMLLRPVNAVGDAVKVILSDTYDVPIEEVGLSDVVRESFDVTDDLAGTITTIETEFTIRVDRVEFAELETVADIVAYVQQEIGDLVEVQMLDRTGIVFEIITVDRYAEALHGLCESGSGVLAIAWLDGIGYTAAEAQGCGLLALQVATGEGGYNQGLLLDIPEPIVEVTPEITPEVTAESTAEVTPEATVEADITETPPPTETSIPEVTPEIETTPEVEITPEATAEFVESDLELRFTTEGLILINATIGSQNLDVVRGRTFCRLGIDDYYSWLIPALYMEENNIDPQRDLGETVDFNNLIPLIRALQSSECTATGISSDVYNQLSEDYPELVEGLTVSSTSVAFPYPVLVYPVEMDLGVRLTLDEQIITLGSEVDSPLQWLLGHSVIVPFEAQRFSEFNNFLASTNFDFAELGD